MESNLNTDKFLLMKEETEDNLKMSLFNSIDYEPTYLTYIKNKYQNIQNENDLQVILYEIILSKIEYFFPQLLYY